MAELTMTIARLLVLLATGVVALTAPVGKPVVSKVEPPNWWPGHSINPVRLLIHGSGLTGSTVTSAPGFKTSNVRVSSSGTYLFVDLTVPSGAAPGSYPLSVRGSGGTAVVPFTLEAPLNRAGRFQGFSPDDVIYLIMVDRFANGDTSNDDPAISQGLQNRADAHFYHGGDLQGIIDHLPYLKSLGITAIWITPVYDNVNELNARQLSDGHPVTDYHGYGTVDYYGIEEHFGSMATLRKLVDEAHRIGIKVIQDQVANHVGPYHPWVTDSPKPTWFHGTAMRHLSETWNVWTLPDQHASENLTQPVLNGWFGDALPDMNQEDPDVAQYEIQNALWWIGMAGFDGIRQDTLPYVPRTFWRRWSAALKKQYPDLRAVGEVFDGDPEIPSFFQGGQKQFDGIDSGVDSVFDFPTYFNIRKVFAQGASFDNETKTLAKDRLYADPMSLVTFLGNHDVMRFMSEPGATGDARVQQLKLAFTFLLTMRGTPEIYYGDEIGMTGGEDPDNRHDFPGGWKGDPRNALEAAGRTPQQSEIFKHVQHLLSLRVQLEPLRRGKMIELAVRDHTWVYERSSATGVAIVALNNGDRPADVEIDCGAAGALVSNLGTAGNLTLHDGKATAHLPARSAEVYTLSKAE